MTVFDWEDWEGLIHRVGVVIDRPKGSAHPRYPTRIYPIDYGYVPGTVGGDGREVDVFAGSGESGLVGVVLTHDAVKCDDEIKLLWNLTEAEIEAVIAFLLGGSMTGRLVRRDIRAAVEQRPVLTAGEVVPQTVLEPPGSPQTSDSVLQVLRTWLRRLLGG